MPARLDDRAVIAVSGPEARSFLQGLITNDIEKLVPGRALYAALLTPQGKILFDFFLVEGDGAILIDCPKEARDALVKRLSMYKLRAKVVIEARDQLEVLASWDGAALPHAVVFPDPRLDALGKRAIGARAEMPVAVAPTEIYHAHRLALGVPESSDFGSDKMFALDADLDELHAVDFEKGCYVGQELTARMKHRGTARKRLLPVASADGGTLPARDTPVTAGGREIGEIASSHGVRGFALLRLDRLSDAGEMPLESGSSVIKVERPGWLFS
jgi:folate-binding protein YgfZ